MNKILIRCVMVCALALSAEAQGTPLSAPRTKHVIGHGWDLLDATTDDVYRNRAKFAATGLDGILMPVDGQTREGRFIRGRNLTATNAYTLADFADATRKIRAMTSLPGLGESLAATFLIPPKRVAWQDDARWATIVNNIGVIARVARESGLKGVSIDHEDYSKARQFNLFPDDPPGTLAKARQRGREFFGALFAAFPEARVLSFWMFSDSGSLWKAFLNGMIDAIPRTAKFIDGNENFGYEANALEDDFRKDVWFIARSLRNTDVFDDYRARAKYDLCVSVSFGQYLDMYTSKEGTPTYYFGPLNGSRVERLEDNLASAVRYCDDCIWVYGERGCWVDWDDKKKYKLSFTPWEKRLPGLARSLRIAVGDGSAIEPEIASGALTNLIANADCEPTKDGKAPYYGWSRLGDIPVFLNEPNDGYPKANCLKLIGDGCFCLGAGGLKVGEAVYVRAWTKGVGGRVGFNWQGGKKKDFYYDRGYFTPTGREVNGWREIFFRMRVPAGFDQLNINFGGPAAPESPILFDNAGIFVRRR